MKEGSVGGWALRPQSRKLAGIGRKPATATRPAHEAAVA
jgi:hypothetical protein